MTYLVRYGTWLLLACACGDNLKSYPPVYPVCSGGPSVDIAMFRGDRERTGWDDHEPSFTPANVRTSFGWLWDSDALDVEGAWAPRIHATPLYFDSVGSQPFVVTATSNGWIYAIAACTGSQRAGTVVWRTRLSSPVFIPDLDGGLPLGVLSTPVADLTNTPPRLYATSASTAGIQLFALDLTSGIVLPGWPLTFDADTIMSVDHNGPAIFEDVMHANQRGALALAPDGGTLYASFASFSDSAPGWLVAVDVKRIAITDSFSAASSQKAVSNGGIWGAGGPAIDSAGGVWATCGNAETGPIPGNWGESLIDLSPTLALTGTYTPFNHCQLDDADTDVGGSSPVLLPDLDPATTSTPHLVAFGSKQGNVYLVDRERLPGALDMRPPCSNDSTTDGSLLPPGPQPQFGARGPLNVFGPYSDRYGNLDKAKMRTPVAWFDDGAGGHYLFATGSSKAAADSATSVPPSVARLAVVTAAGQPAYLAIDAVDHELAFANSGAPLVTSSSSHDPIVWVVDQNSSRTASTLDPNLAHPILYAVDGETLTPLWQSPPAQLGLGAKYASVTVAHGWVFVATDRVQAFGLR
jgi:hypothetical protein